MDRSAQVFGLLFFPKQLTNIEGLLDTLCFSFVERILVSEDEGVSERPLGPGFVLETAYSSSLLEAGLAYATAT